MKIIGVTRRQRILSGSGPTCVITAKSPAKIINKKNPTAKLNICCDCMDDLLSEISLPDGKELIKYTLLLWGIL